MAVFGEEIMNYVRLMDYWVEVNLVIDEEHGVTEKVIVSIGNSRLQTDTRPRLIDWLCVDGWVIHFTLHQLIATDWFFKPRTHVMELGP